MLTPLIALRENISVLAASSLGLVQAGSSRFNPKNNSNLFYFDTFSHRILQLSFLLFNLNKAHKITFFNTDFQALNFLHFWAHWRSLSSLSFNAFLFSAIQFLCCCFLLSDFSDFSTLALLSTRGRLELRFLLAIFLSFVSTFMQILSHVDNKITTISTALSRTQKDWLQYPLQKVIIKGMQYHCL